MKGESMTTAAVKKRLRSKDAECIFHELLIADAAISPEMEEMARAAARSAVVEYEDAGVHEQTGSHWRSSRVLRRAVIVFIVAAFFVFSGYLSMTPSGQALAASFTESIMQIFDDGFLFSPAITPAPTEYPEGVTETMWELQDFQMASSMTGRKFLQIHNDAFSLEDLVLYEQGVAGNMLSASYCTKDRLYIALQQEWDFSGSAWMELDTGKTWEETLQDGETILHCYIDTADNNKFTAIGVWRDSMITIYADSSIPYEDVLAAISLP